MQLPIKKIDPRYFFKKAYPLILLGLAMLLLAALLPAPLPYLSPATQQTAQTEIPTTLGIINLLTQITTAFDYPHFSFVLPHPAATLLLPIVILLRLLATIFTQKNTQNNRTKNKTNIIILGSILLINIPILLLYKTNILPHLSPAFYYTLLFTAGLLIPVIFASLVQAVTLTILNEKIIHANATNLNNKISNNFKQLLLFQILMLPLLFLPELLYLLQQIISPINGNNNHKISQLIETALPASYYIRALCKLLLFPLPLFIIGRQLSLWKAFKQNIRLIFCQTKHFAFYIIYGFSLLLLPVLLRTLIEQSISNNSLHKNILMPFIQILLYTIGLYFTTNILYTITQHKNDPTPRR